MVAHLRKANPPEVGERVLTRNIVKRTPIIDHDTRYAEADPALTDSVGRALAGIATPCPSGTGREANQP